VQSFAKTANDSINYVINSILFFGGKKSTTNTNNINDTPTKNENKNSITSSNSSNTNTTETVKIDFNNEVKIEKNTKK
jgi:hypothetical protein